MRLTGKTALVTGGSRGIGSAIAEALASEGALVAIGYATRRDDAEATLARIRAAGGDGEIVKLDVTDAGAVEQIVAELLARRERIDVLACAAGVSRDQLFALSTEAEWRDVVDVNLLGAMRCARAVARPMMGRGGGAIVNVSSIAGARASVGQAGYAASKGGLVAFTRTLAAELAPKGVRANAIVPGLIDAGMVKRMDRRHRDARAAHIPMGRLGRPEEVARAAVFLASDDASYVTGQALVVDGGLSS
jgi:3-oxoacyl-[acyl-carrier protein] reductase